MSDHARKICYALFIAAIINFASFYIIAVLIGGDAVNGKVENGKYYIANHGKYTEVSKSVFIYSRLHTYSMWVTHPVGILAMGYLSVRGKRKGKGHH